MPTKRLLSFIFCVIFISVTQADIRSATGKPFLDFYTVYGAISAAKITNEICNSKFPEYKEQNDLAYESWRKRYKEFLYKMEQYDHAITEEVSKGNEDTFRELMYQSAMKYEENKAYMHNIFTEMGEAVYQATCSSYPEYLLSEKADFQNYYREHIEVFEGYWLSN